MLSAEEVRQTGQSLWLDDLSRDLLFSGALGRYIAGRAVTGLTSNPSIFEKALAGEYYAAPMKELAALATPAEEIFEVLAVEDIQRAADMLLPAFDAAGGLDGFVSMEVSPGLAHDAARTESEGLRLAARIGRPNLMIKVPATKEGLLAGENLLKAGVSVNFTLIFSVDRYRAVTQAYTAAMSWRARNALPAEGVASVASFFVSRIDTAVDKALRALPGGAGAGLLGRAGIANSLLAYRLYRELFYCPGFKASGLPPQRILWASTGVKDTAYRPSLYMEQLALKGSVNTAPGDALEAYFAAGEPNKEPLEARCAAAEAHFAELKRLGVDFPAILRDLERDGLEKFARSHDGLLARIERERQAAFTPGERDRGPAGAEQAFQALAALNFPARFLKKDPALWSGGSGEKKQIASALLWPDAPFKLLPKAKEIEKFVSEIIEEGFTAAVLLGAGGPALAAEALRGAFQNPKFPRLFVPDTDNPAWLEAVRAQLDLKRTLFVCAWDGACAGPEARQKYFWSLVKKAGVKEPGRNFIAITAPDAPLEKLAHLKKFRRVFTDAAGAGGFSALSWAALLPAALCGAEVSKLLERAIDLASRSREADIPKNPGCALGALLAHYAAAGRDKVTLLAPGRLRQFAAWAEHLLAGSVGPGGVIPVSGEQLMEPDKYQADRFFVQVRLQGFDDPAEDKALEALGRAGHPVYTITLKDPYDLGGEFFRWQTAAAAAGALLGINPFAPWAADCEGLGALAKTGKLPAPRPDFSSERMAVYASPALAAGGIAGYDDVFWSVFSTLGEKEYISLLAYLPPEAKVEAALARLRGTLARYTSSACALSWGSRCLYSAGRLHREGPDKGVFVILTSQARKDILVPGEKYTFWQLETAQAGGDFNALVSKGRRVLRLHLKHPLDRSLAYIAERIARLGKTGKESAEASEESEMLKLAVKKNTKTTNKTTTPATKIVNTNEYVVVDYPKNLENLTSRHYSVRIGASDCTGVDISINDQPWQPCRHAAGYWWFDWNNYQPGTHQLVARMHKRNGEYLISKRRRCKAA